ncbi:MAG: Rv3235 family protein [Gordonia sp. (in: high G+C Gram-positive bacteria)]|uniref:Rv3235 family protein n=1 Tax=Gordonia sp. (in: high G+C Gram-positive bacteria) TaxID=84139 RepID=UPI0039E32FA4
MYMDTQQVVVRPAPPFEHPGQWAQPCACSARDRQPPPALVSAAVPPTPPTPPAERSVVGAREFAIAAMTVILEVLDRRRPVVALQPFVAPAVADHVLSRGRAKHEARSARAGVVRAPDLRLRRLHVQLVAEGQAEFFGSYACGARVRAFAGRMAVPKRRRGKQHAEPAVPWQVRGLMLD